jgi:Uma2 family endonuclease
VLTAELNREEDLIRLYDGKYELVEGVIKQMAPAGEEHGIITARIIYNLLKFVDENKLGIVTTSETGYKLSSNPDTVKAPDAAYKSKERFEKGGKTKGYSTVMPELVVEVNSPSDSYGEVVKKVNLWLKSGVLEVWVVEPDSRMIIVYYSDGGSKIFYSDDEISGGSILPGFKFRVKDIFEY